MDAIFSRTKIRMWTVDLSNLTIKGVFFSLNVQEALGTIVQQGSTAHPP